MVSKRVRFSRWWRRSGMGLRLAVFLVSCGLLGALVYYQRPSDEGPVAGNGLLVFALVQINIVALCILAFLIGRNVVRLIFDRRKNILGSKLRVRLLLAFLGLTLVPTSILFVLASGLLTQSMEGWFSSHVEGAIKGAISIGQLHFSTITGRTERGAARIRRLIERGEVATTSTVEARSRLNSLRQEEELFSLHILNGAGREILGVANPAFQEPELTTALVEKALRGESEMTLEERDSNQFYRGYIPLRLDSERGVLIVSARIAPEVTFALTQIRESSKEYELLKLYKSPLKSGYLLTLAMITALLVFAAVWFAFFLARELVGPIQKLAEGTEAVARGNLDFQIRAPADDELGQLVKSFNQMTRDLKHSRIDAERRRVYLETILANLAVGVVALDPKRRITSMNEAAGTLLGIEKIEAVLGSDALATLKPQIAEQLGPLLDELGEEGGGSVRDRELRLTQQGRELKVVCAAGRVVDVDQKSLGTVLIFDDVTELAKAQHMSAWREVARRVAHEIKNPLTPIQLSAQRLQKQLEGSVYTDVVRESVGIIVENVDSIKRLANEFSRFSRMPTAEFQSSDLKALIADTLAPYAERFPAVVFQLIADQSMPAISIDREQVRRVIINILDNAVAAVLKDRKGGTEEDPPRIVVRSWYERKRRMGVFEIADNGPGVRDEDKVRIFEPYFTTKKEGSGLGLAIVNSIVLEHQGRIRVNDNHPRGAAFVVELPLTPAVGTQRRFVVAPEGGAV